MEHLSVRNVKSCCDLAEETEILCLCMCDPLILFFHTVGLLMKKASNMIDRISNIHIFLLGLIVYLSILSKFCLIKKDVVTVKFAELFQS